MNSSLIAKYRVTNGKNFKLGDIDPGDTGDFEPDQKPEAQEKLAEGIQELQTLQDVMSADDRYALLIIFQAMDAAGKDSTIKHVMSGVNPQGCQVFSFKEPSTEELDHDFMWRYLRCLPERGRIGIFNRSYYEEVLIVRVHREILSNEELPEELLKDKDFWEDRYQSILNLEAHLHRNGTRIRKFFLHLSKEEQRKRFLKRIDDPEKNWKFSADDIKERAYWKQYMKAYEACVSATSTKNSPWYIVPADDKETTGLIISQVVLEALEDLDMAYPKTSPGRRRELQAIRKKLAGEK